MKILKKPGVRAKYLARRAREGLRGYVTDSTALLVATTPIFAALETNLASMTNENSINARLLGTALTYAGTGLLYARGLDKSRNFFKLNKKTKGKVKFVHDASYGVLFNLLISPPFFYAAGVRDPWQIGIATATSMGMAVVAGGPVGYALDVFRDLAGTKNCERESYSKIVKNQSHYIKKAIATSLVAASIVLTCGVYRVNDYLRPPQNPTIQQVQPEQLIQPTQNANLEKKVEELK